MFDDMDDDDLNDLFTEKDGSEEDEADGQIRTRRMTVSEVRLFTYFYLLTLF